VEPAQDSDGSDGRWRIAKRFLLRKMAQQAERVGDQGIDQHGPGLLVIPGDLRLARVTIVVPGALRGRHLGCAGHLADHSAHRRDQLGDGVLG
jgi:hypothetical protein